MEAIGLRGSHVERLINSERFTQEDWWDIHYEVNKNCSLMCNSGYNLWLLVSVAGFFIIAITDDELVTELSTNAPLEEKKCYLVDVGFPAAMVAVLLMAIPESHMINMQPMKLTYEFAYVGATLYSMQHEGKLPRGWLDDAILNPSSLLTLAKGGGRSS
ncbi:uncharacterized protein ACA1_090410 [Acanthamoeba castellanii str. Neff]|uniref:Uncharacterized protein n=1 Tax=Acanthamoeba castellanii (strain ATCC 30010 / Neff) TaxID=1257118 RepID=L8GUY6_ACACF|nr:uncharacterized protein ACA1_090410 [Acanthamoeba castellanii str. Neff]ELR16742.1 hypothetical protein ACA1_090410 [Acanthamoeba castellanii str. Neff]